MDKDKLNILLEINKKLKIFEYPIINKLQSKKYLSDIKQDLENFVNLLNTNKIKSAFIEKIYDKTLRIIENSYKIKNQKLIYEFYFNYFKVKLEKIKNNFQKKEQFLIKMKKFDFDLKENFQNKYLKELKNLKFCKSSISEIIKKAKIYNVDLIEPKYKDFFKSLEAFENKIISIEKDLKLIEDSSNIKLNGSKIICLSYDLEDFIKTQFEYFINEFKRAINESNNDNNGKNNPKNHSNINDHDQFYIENNSKNLFRDLLASFESFWKNLNENHLKELINIESIKVFFNICKQINNFIKIYKD